VAALDLHRRTFSLRVSDTALFSLCSIAYLINDGFIQTQRKRKTRWQHTYTLLLVAQNKKQKTKYSALFVATTPSSVKIYIVGF